MSDTAIPVTLIAAVGVLLTVIAWQIFGMVRERARMPHGPDADALDDLRRRIAALERRGGA